MAKTVANQVTQIINLVSEWLVMWVGGWLLRYCFHNFYQEVDYENDTISLWACDILHKQDSFRMMQLNEDDRRSISDSSGTYQCIRLNN